MDIDNLPMYAGVVPAVTTDQMREVDRLMIEFYHIELIQMMENAGRNLAHLARLRFLNGDPSNKRVVVLAGTGGNGGGALVCARWLHNAGADVHVYLTAAPERLTSVPAHQLAILHAVGIASQQAEAVGSQPIPDLIIDGLIGYSLTGSPHGAAADLITWANSMDTPVLALDVPSGLNSTSGEAFAPVIRADATMTLALPKTGLLVEHAKPYVGELYLANISVPRGLYRHPTLDLSVENLFRTHDIVRLA